VLELAPNLIGEERETGRRESEGHHSKVDNDDANHVATVPESLAVQTASPCKTRNS
jgi:hypothetical protein